MNDKIVLYTAYPFLFVFFLINFLPINIGALQLFYADVLHQAEPDWLHYATNRYVNAVKLEEEFITFYAQLIPALAAIFCFRSKKRDKFTILGKIIFLLLSLNIALGSFSLLFIDKDCDIVHTILLDNPAEDIMKLKAGIMGAVRFAITYLLFFLGMNINTGGNHAPDRADSISVRSSFRHYMHRKHHHKGIRP